MQFKFSANGLEFGAYEGDTLKDACEAFAKDAGYQSWSAMTEQAIENAGMGNIEVTDESGIDVSPDQSEAGLIAWNA